MHFLTVVSEGLHHVLTLCPSSSWHHHPSCPWYFLTLGWKDLAVQGPCSQHLASLLNLWFDRGLFKWGICVLHCSVSPLSNPGALWAQGVSILSHCGCSVQHWSPHPHPQFHSFFFPFPTLWISNIIPKQLKPLEIIFPEWVAPALPLPTAGPALGLPHQAPLLLTLP